MDIGNALIVVITLGIIIIFVILMLWVNSKLEK